MFGRIICCSILKLNYSFSKEEKLIFISLLVANKFLQDQNAAKRYSKTMYKKSTEVDLSHDYM